MLRRLKFTPVRPELARPPVFLHTSIQAIHSDCVAEFHSPTSLPAYYVYRISSFCVRNICKTQPDASVSLIAFVQYMIQLVAWCVMELPEEKGAFSRQYSDARSGNKVRITVSGHIVAQYAHVYYYI